MRLSQVDEITRCVEAAFQAVSRRDWVPAETLCKTILATAPDHADALHLLALTYKLSGRLHESLPVYERLVARHADAPFIATVLGNYGNALREAAQFGLAEQHLRRALALRPGAADVLNHLGLVRQDVGDLVQAEQCFKAAVEASPEFGEAWNNYGGVLQRLGHLQDALQAYRRALEKLPAFAPAHYNIGNLLADSGYVDEAISHYRAALAANPDYVEAMLGWLRQSQNACDWQNIPALSKALRDWVETRCDGRVFPFAFIGIDTTAREQLACARQWVEAKYLPLASQLRPQSFVFSRGERPRLRIGYLSSDFHNHATAYLLAEIIELHDRARFEIIAYSAGPDDGKDMRKRLVAAFDRFVDIQHLPHLQAAQRIYDDNVDILVDLKGYTKDTRSAILAFRPAPIAVNYLGYPGTLGASIADYIITDRYISPPDYDGHFVERLVYMPDCYQPNDRRRRIGATVSRSVVGLPDAGVVFCCFNHSYKITQVMFEHWCALLLDVPDSVLWLLKSNAAAERNLRQAAERYGVRAERLRFAPELPLADHLARMGCADIFLDTFPVNAHTTASDALWAGIPVVTLSGETFISRVAGSLLHAAGLPELATDSVVDYLACARDLARDTARVGAYKQRLAAQRATLPLFDSVRYTRALERRYGQMWESWRVGRVEALMD